jgi:hypothetical protein
MVDINGAGIVRRVSTWSTHWAACARGAARSTSAATSAAVGRWALTWELIGALRYWLPWKPGDAETWLDAGYRVISLKQSTTSPKLGSRCREGVIT